MPVESGPRRRGGSKGAAVEPRPPVHCTQCKAVLPPDAPVCPKCSAPRPSSPDEPFDETVVREKQVVLEGKWSVKQKLGEGGMGAVYLAHDVALDRPVAIKMLSPALSRHEEVVTRFEREARLLAKLEHPNLVPIYGVGRRGATPFIVMKYLEGQTLADLLHDRSRLTCREVVPLLRQVCAGLGFIHARGVIHRDIKPGNLFVGLDGHLTLLDFGVAHDPNHQLTRTGLLIGTPQYMAPEQVTGTGKVDHRADLYALATVLFESLTGGPVFTADNEYELLRAHQDRPAPDASTVQREVPRAVSAILQRALAKGPDERFNSAAALLAAFEQAVAESDSDAGRVTEHWPTAPHAGQAADGPKRVTPSPQQASVSPALSPPPRRGATPHPPSEAEATRQAIAAARLGSSTRRPLALGMLVGLLIAAAGSAVAWRILRAAEPVPMPLELDSAPPPRVVPPSPAPPPKVPVAPPQQAEAPVRGAPSNDPKPVPVLPRPAEVPIRGLPLGDKKPVGSGAAVPAKKGGATLGELRVTTTRKGELFWAWLEVDGVRKGATPLTLGLNAGTHEVRIERSGLAAVSRTVTVEPGQTTQLQVELEP